VTFLVAVASDSVAAPRLRIRTGIMTIAKLREATRHAVPENHGFEERQCFPDRGSFARTPYGPPSFRLGGHVERRSPRNRTGIGLTVDDAEVASFLEYRLEIPRGEVGVQRRLISPSFNQAECAGGTYLICNIEKHATVRSLAALAMREATSRKASTSLGWMRYVA
jgi:hypothetical protein